MAVIQTFPKYQTNLIRQLRVDAAFPCIVEWFHLLCTIAVLVKFAADESDDKVFVLVHDFFTPSACDVDPIRVEQTLRDQGELCQDGWVPLHDMFLGSSQPGG